MIKSTTSTTYTPAPKPSLSVDGFTPLVNARGGANSHAVVLLFALEEYRTARIEEMLQCVSSGDYQDAENHKSDADAASTMILEFGLSLAALADSNYWATQPTRTDDTQAETVRKFVEKYLPGLYTSETSTPDQQ